MIIISGSNSHLIAKSISEYLNINHVKANVTKFEDQELKVSIQADIFQKNVLVVQSTSTPVNDHLMELLLIIDAVRRAGAARVDVLVPYLGYSRQDKHYTKHDPIPLKLVLQLIQSAGANEVITLDLHSARLINPVENRVINLDSVNLFVRVLQECKKMDIHNVVIVAPDIGGTSRAKLFSNKLGAELIILSKTRSDLGKVCVKVTNDIQGKNCILVDDIIDTAGTVIAAAKELTKAGALSVNCFITHAVLSGDSQELINSSVIEKIYISDSITQVKITQANVANKFIVIPTAEFFAEIIFSRFISS